MLNPDAQFRRRALFASLGAFALALIIWNIPQLNFLLYPIRLFVTFVHESGHGLAAIASGGSLNGFQVFANGTGVATTSGGNIVLILPAGYIGAAIFGALLFYLANTLPYPRTIAVVLGIILAVITLFYTLSAPVAFVVGGVSSALLILLGWRGGRGLNLVVLNFLGLTTALHAVLDLVYLIGASDSRLGAVQNDAAAFSAAVAPLIPAAVWAALWALLAVAALALAVYYSVLRRLWRS
ncbi:MAG: M50 family metallopeptidase [Anaerolineae bacterium]|nr:M50 family metallopeptidase [Anaerolineae bacterium]MCA9911253.1 M50 family metallopeptidase [Anaerolineae bacterium]